MIPVRNIYYMLAYAFQVLHEQGYKDVAAEGFPKHRRVAGRHPMQRRVCSD